MGDEVKVEKDGAIATVTLNRPKVFNALDMEMALGLTSAFMELARDDSVLAVVVTGAGKAFFAGGDLGWMQSFPRGPSSALHELAARFHLAVLEVRRMRKPVIAAINGAAAGAGFSMALACDFRVMDKKAVLKQAYTSVGLSIDGGGTFMLPRLVGLARALEIAAFDAPISADQALEWGLVTRVADEGKAVEEAYAMARELMAMPINSFAWSKKLLNDSFSSSLEAQLERERKGISSCAGHPDGEEGIKAFLEKRKPKFNQGVRSSHFTLDSFQKGTKDWR